MFDPAFLNEIRLTSHPDAIKAILDDPYLRTVLSDDDRRLLAPPVEPWERPRQEGSG